MRTVRTQRLEELRALVRAVEGDGSGGVCVRSPFQTTPPLATDAMGGRTAGAGRRYDSSSDDSCVNAPWLARGVVQEWFGLATLDHGVNAPFTPMPRWTPPLGMLLFLADRSLRQLPDRYVVWIGRRCWPYPHALIDRGDDNDHSFVARTLLVDCPDKDSRLWAIDLAVHCSAVTAVIADGGGLDMAATRRLQLAAKSSDAMVLLTRPPSELDRLSACGLRWLVCSEPSETRAPRWIVQLLRCKGLQPESEAFCAGNDARWAVEWNRAQGRVVVHAALVNRSDSEKALSTSTRDVRRSA